MPVIETTVVLAAGRGKRMGNLTEDLPKPMLPLNGKPLLEHTLDRLRAAGFRRALIVTGYRAEVIESHFAGYPMEIEYRRQETLNGTGATALLAENFAANDDFLLTHGDILAAPSDYRGMVSIMENGPSVEAVLGVKYVDDPWQGAAVYEDDGRITQIIEKPPRGTSSTHWNSAGLYVFRPSVFAELARLPKSARGEYELTTAIEQMIAAGKHLRIYGLQGNWLDVGRPGDLETAQEIV